MRLTGFMTLVEIRTKLASIIPFSLGTIYAIYHFKKFDIKTFIVFFISMLAFDMVTTALNNYYDFKRAKRTKGFNYETYNGVVRASFKDSFIVYVILVLLLIAVIFGIILVLNTNLVVLGIGALSFLVGILYSFGPVPISTTPLGEVLSGFFMGFVIIFLSAYIHIYDSNFVSLMFQNSFLLVGINTVEVIYVFLFSLPAICTISNIMMANNICDMEEDIDNHRLTMVIYIGKQNALRLFKLIYYIAYIDIIMLVLLRLTPWFMLFAMATIIPVSKNIKLFELEQNKKSTFGLSVKNFVLINVSMLLIMAVGVIIYPILSNIALAA